MPRNVPRILINRTIVHPSASSATASTTDDDADPEDIEFRENYVFDAYLLGFCDDVTRALARQLFRVPEIPTKTTIKTKSSDDKSQKATTNSSLQRGYGGRLLTTVLDDEDEDHSSDDWSIVTVPPERVLLFHGALASKNDTSELTYREIAHCDGCSKQIRGTIHKCMACFDYDLCRKCFPRLSKTHFGGKHTFSAEKSSI